MFNTSAPVVKEYCSLAERQAEAKMWDAFINGDGLFDWRLVIIDDDESGYLDECDFDEFGYGDLPDAQRIARRIARRGDSDRLEEEANRAAKKTQSSPAPRAARIHARHAHVGTSSDDNSTDTPISAAAQKGGALMNGCTFFPLVERYAALGMSMLPLEPGTKKPRGKDWPNNGVKDAAIAARIFGYGNLWESSSATTLVDLSTSTLIVRRR